MANTNSFFSLAILIISIIVVLPFSRATPRLTTTNDPINTFCQTAENKTLCSSIVKGARTWPSATTYAISKTLKIAKQGKPMFDDLVKMLQKEYQDIGLSRIAKEAIGQTCNEIYDFAIECLQGALEDLKYGYMDRLATKLSSVTGPSFVCTDSVRKLGMDSRLFNFFSELELYSRTCLSVARSA